MLIQTATEGQIKVSKNFNCRKLRTILDRRKFVFSENEELIKGVGNLKRHRLKEGAIRSLGVSFRRCCKSCRNDKKEEMSFHQVSDYLPYSKLMKTSTIWSHF